MKAQKENTVIAPLTSALEGSCGKSKYSSTNCYVMTISRQVVGFKHQRRYVWENIF